MSSILLPSSAINWGQPVNRSSPLNRGLVSWWLGAGPTVGSGTWFDIAGRNHGTLTNMDPGTDWVASTVNGQRYALDFDGSNDYVNIGTDSSLNITGPFTVLASINMNSFNADNTLVGGYDTSSPFNGYGFGVGVASASNTQSLWTGGSWRQSNTALSAGTWYGVGVTVNGTTVNFYLNGIQDGSPAGAGNPASYTGARALGATALGATNRFPAKVAYIRLYNRALSSDEVYQIYQDSLTGYKKTLNRLTRTFAYSSGAAAAVYNPFTGGINPLQGFIAA